MKKRTIEDVNVDNKRVFVRCDFNVPMSDDGVILDDNRIVAALPTIKYLIDNNAKIILCSHLGRPKGTFNPKYSLAPIAKRLSQLLNMDIQFALDVIGEDAQKKVASLKGGQVLLLENIRFHAEEESNDEAFSKTLSQFADIYVNDAFGAAHRAHSSTAGIAKFCSDNVCGYLIEKEVRLLDDALQDPKRPFVAVLGGAKVSDKIGVIESLLKKADSVLIGGAMAYTFMAAKGISVGNSRLESNRIELANSIMEKASRLGVQLLLPIDNVAAIDFSSTATPVYFNESIEEGYMGLDIGNKTCELFSKVISEAATIFWNGPMGVFEFEAFANGTKRIALAVACNSNAISIIGGGDSAAVIELLNLKDKITHVSTGGGASLELIEGKALPGIACLDDKESN